MPSAETSVRDDDLRAGTLEALVDDLLAENRRRGVDPDGWTPSARWKREGDIPNRVLFGALEAMEPGGP